MGGLQKLKASKAAQRRYDVAVNYFLWVSIYLHGHLARSDEELDQHCAEFLKLCWSEGEPRWLAADCISGLQYKLQRKRLFPVQFNFADFGPILKQLVSELPTAFAGCLRQLTSVTTDGSDSSFLQPTASRPQRDILPLPYSDLSFEELPKFC